MAIEIQGVRAAQAPAIHEAFRLLTRRERFDVVIEIGTLRGGFSLFLREAFGEAAEIHTFDIKAVESQTPKGPSIAKKLGRANIQQHVVDACSNKGLSVISGLLERGRAIVLCDGGNKIREVTSVTPLLRAGDFIMAHDYAYDKDAFKELDWPAHEISWSDVSQVAEDYGLQAVYSGWFDPAVWLCMEKL